VAVGRGQCELDEGIQGAAADGAHLERRDMAATTHGLEGDASHALGSLDRLTPVHRRDHLPRLGRLKTASARKRVRGQGLEWEHAHGRYHAAC